MNYCNCPNCKTDNCPNAVDEAEGWHQFAPSHGSVICVWCERKLTPAPTKLWWFKHTRAGFGLCYECALSSAENVLRALSHAAGDSPNEKGQP